MDWVQINPHAPHILDLAYVSAIRDDFTPGAITDVEVV